MDGIGLVGSLCGATIRASLRDANKTLISQTSKRVLPDSISKFHFLGEGEGMLLRSFLSEGII